MTDASLKDEIEKQNELLLTYGRGAFETNTIDMSGARSRFHAI